LTVLLNEIEKRDTKVLNLGERFAILENVDSR
jgi:hypothetical protein